MTDEMKNKGFTLTELLGTIVILAIIALVAFPAVLGLLNNSQDETDEALKNFAITGARNYVNDNMDSFPKALSTDTSVKSYGNAGNLTIQSLVDEGYISDTTIDSTKNCEMLNDYVKVTSDSKKYIFEYVEVDGGC